MYKSGQSFRATFIDEQIFPSTNEYLYVKQLITTINVFCYVEWLSDFLLTFFHSIIYAPHNSHAPKFWNSVWFICLRCL